MQIQGEWHLCDDGVERPVIHIDVLTGDGSWVRAPFLVDTGADCTVLSADVLAALDLETHVGGERLGGLGGLVGSVEVATILQFAHEQDGAVTFRGRFAAVTSIETLDMSVLGRDITGLFALVVDRPDNVVCLLGQRHRYAIISG